MFNCGDQLSWIRDKDGFSFIQQMSEAAVRLRMAESAYYFTCFETDRGERIEEVFPLIPIVQSVMATKEWSHEMAPPLKMIATSPRFTKEGVLILTPGYHKESGIFYNPSNELLDLDIPPNPTPEQVKAAVDFLLYGACLGNFPFLNQASRANALACMLLTFVRQMIDSSIPIHHFESAVEGTGKSKLAKVCAFPAVGHTLGSNPQKEDEAEWRKATTAKLLTGPSHFLIDNLKNPKFGNGDEGFIDSGVLAVLTTERIWEDRELGNNRQVRVKIETIVMTTGNSIQWSKELTRRIVPITIRADVQDPTTRSDWLCGKIGHEKWLTDNRRELVTACLTICQNWIAKGKPPGGGHGDHTKNMSQLWAASWPLPTSPTSSPT
jgi:putative DNA primase/helicase